MKDDAIPCTECGKTRKAHFDSRYCYAATRRVHDVVHVLPITDYVYNPIVVQRDARSACPEVRGVRFRYALADWLQEQRLHQRMAVLNGLRSNFWKAYVDTVVYMAK